MRHKYSFLGLLSALMFSLFLSSCNHKDHETLDLTTLPSVQATDNSPATTEDPVKVTPVLQGDAPPASIEAYRGCINDDPEVLAEIRKHQNEPLPDTPNRWFLSGINEFEHAGKLNGCKRDMERLAVFLVRRCGIQPNEIRIITDKQVTKNAVVIGWTWARKATGVWGVAHSGHGALWPSYVPGEPATVSRVICMHDFNWTRETCVSNTEFKTIFKQKNTPAVKPTTGSGSVSVTVTDARGTAWVDTCYSGDLLRSISHSNNTVRGLTPPPEIQAEITTILKNGGKHETLRDMLPPKITVIEMAGPKKPGADSYDEAGLAVGAGSFYTLKHLEFKLNKPLADNMQEVCADMVHDDYDQSPQVEGPDRNLPFKVVK